MCVELVPLQNTTQADGAESIAIQDLPVYYRVASHYVTATAGGYAACTSDDAHMAGDAST